MDVRLLSSVSSQTNKFYKLGVNEKKANLNNIAPTNPLRRVEYPVILKRKANPKKKLKEHHRVRE